MHKLSTLKIIPIQINLATKLLQNQIHLAHHAPSKSKCSKIWGDFCPRTQYWDRKKYAPNVNDTQKCHTNNEEIR